MTAALEAVGLSKHYGDRVALDDVTLRIDDGEFVALIGHNGSGKSTFLSIAAGLLDASAGEVIISGQPAGSLDARAHLSFIPDNPVLFDDLSLIEHLEYVARLHGVEEWSDWAWRLLDALDITDRADEIPTTFSRGLRQRAALAVGMVRPASVVAIDEPFVGLDAPSRNSFSALVDRFHAQGTTVVLATHQLEVAGRVERVIALKDGRLVHDGPPDGVDLVALVEG